MSKRASNCWHVVSDIFPDRSIAGGGEIEWRKNEGQREKKQRALSDSDNVTL